MAEAAQVSKSFRRFRILKASFIHFMWYFTSIATFYAQAMHAFSFLKKHQFKSASALLCRASKHQSKRFAHITKKESQNLQLRIKRNRFPNKH
ncbi:MAG: hypothetical protein LBU32_16645 [Clostridiales bacterium]|nr:hypothetical protein [Clostridiales bacterium]